MADDDLDPRLDPVFVGHRLRFDGYPATPANVARRLAAEGMRRCYHRNYLAGALWRAEQAGDVATAARLRQELADLGPPRLTATPVPLLPLP